jgi:low affinity Fe/Cu permease
MLALFGLTLAIMLGFVDNYSLSQNSVNTVMLFMLSALIIQTAKFSDSSETRSDDIGKQTLDTRLQELINSLSQAGSAISGIEREIDSRQELAEKLEKQKMIAEEAIKLSKEQVDAVSALLSKQLQNKAERIAGLIGLSRYSFLF